MQMQGSGAALAAHLDAHLHCVYPGRWLSLQRLGMHERLHVLGEPRLSRAREPQRVLPVYLRRPLTRLVVCGIGGIGGNGALFALAFHRGRRP